MNSSDSKAKSSSTRNGIRVSRRTGRRFGFTTSLVALAAFFLLAFFTASASAALTRAPLGQFGGTGGPTFSRLGGLAVDQTTGDVYAYDSGAEAVLKFNSAGAPVNFSGLGSNQITGVGGAGPGENEIAVDSSSGETAGDIYVANNTSLLIFGPDGLPRGESGGLTGEEPCGVAVDSAGNVYVGRYSSTVDKYAPTPGEDAPTDADRSPHPLTAPIGLCNVGVQGDGSNVYAATYFGGLHMYTADQFGEPEASGSELDPAANTLAVDPVSDHVLADEGNQVAEFDSAGNPAATFGSGELSGSAGIAVNSANDEIYVADGETIEVFGPTITIPNVNTKPATNNSGTKATLNGSVFPENVAVSECKFEYGTTSDYGNSKPCEGAIPTDEGEHPVTAALTNLMPNGATYHFRIVVNSASTPVKGADESFLTPDTVITGAAPAVTDHSATVGGEVKTDGVSLTECKFEYGPDASYGSSQACVPAFGEIPTDSTFHPVSADLIGLEVNSTYHFRLVAANANGPIIGRDDTFTTAGPPQIIQEVATNVGQTAATLQAKINPSGFAATYYFEWGTDTSYGHRVPFDEETTVGSGDAPAIVGAEISGLQETATYHFRVVAANSSGTIPGPDHEFMTLDSSGLPDDRGFELVSPADKRPQGAAAQELPEAIDFQTAEDGQSVTFPYLGALESARGGDASYLAKRSATGWESTDISPPSLVTSPINGPKTGSATPGVVEYYSPDLSCGVVASFNPLSADTPTADVELGITNLYRRNPDGSYTLITGVVPLNSGINPKAENGNLFHGKVVGASSDCSRIYFSSEYEYVHEPTSLYEWHNGTLRDAALLPDGTVPVGTLAIAASGNIITVAPGGEYSGTGSRVNSVSRDGSRLFFTALSDEPETAGKVAVFVGEDGLTTVEASRKAAGGTASSLGAQYEIASPDGSQVFFTATYGLTASSSMGPQDDCSNIGLNELGSGTFCDLYDYDVDTGTLEDLSADPNVADPQGAAVDGVVAVSDDGSSVYFAARGQLIPGKGKTYAENISGSGSANMYLERGGNLFYVATIDRSDLGQVLARSTGWTSEATPDGAYLLFASGANVTGYESGGAYEAYRYSTRTQTTECVSCRFDGLPSVGYPPGIPLNPPLVAAFPNQATWQSNRSGMSSNGSRIFFTMPDVLAPGAVSGENNLYEWENGQVYFLASGEPIQLLRANGTAIYGSSASGSDVFIHTPKQLDPHDTDTVQDVYDLRVGGGFPPPPPSPTQCDPTADQCQGTATAPPSATGSATAGPTVPVASPRCKKGKVRGHGRCLPKKHQRKAKRGDKRRHHRGSTKHHKEPHKRAANTDRGGSR